MRRDKERFGLDGGNAMAAYASRDPFDEDTEVSDDADTSEEAKKTVTGCDDPLETAAAFDDGENEENEKLDDILTSLRAMMDTIDDEEKSRRERDDSEEDGGDAREEAERLRRELEEERAFAKEMRERMDRLEALLAAALEAKGAETTEGGEDAVRMASMSKEEAQRVSVERKRRASLRPPSYSAQAGETYPYVNAGAYAGGVSAPYGGVYVREGDIAPKRRSLWALFVRAGIFVGVVGVSLVFGLYGMKYYLERNIETLEGAIEKRPSSYADIGVDRRYNVERRLPSSKRVYDDSGANLSEARLDLESEKKKPDNTKKETDTRRGGEVAEDAIVKEAAREVMRLDEAKKPSRYYKVVDPASEVSRSPVSVNSPSSSSAEGSQKKRSEGGLVIVNDVALDDEAREELIVLPSADKDSSEMILDLAARKKHTDGNASSK